MSMTARVLKIEERHLQTPFELASLADFTCTEGEEIDSAVVVEDSDVSLYCFDDASKQAIFVQLPSGVDLTKAAFVYLAQGEQAERLIAVPYDAFMQVAAELPKVENLIPIYISGRSGSTLMSRAFNELDTVMSLAEPDVATQFAYLREADGSRDAELSKLIDGAVRFLFKPNPHNKASTFALKFRNEAVRVMDLYGATFPQAKNLFSYRDAVGFAASMHRLFKGWGQPERQPLSEWLPFFEKGFKKNTNDLKAYLGESDEEIPLVKFFALWWLFPLETYLAQRERGVPILAVRYDDLNTHREAVLHGIFTYCGLPVPDVEKALRAFTRDAQAGTVLARADPKQGNALRLSEEQIADIYNVLQHHPVINTPDYELPGTLRV